MKEACDSRVLGAIRWVDAVSLTPISLPLIATASPPYAGHLQFIRNYSGLTVITHADGLEALIAVFDLKDLDPADAVDPGALPALAGEVSDPSGNYLPRKFTLALPRDPDSKIDAETGLRPDHSLFEPEEIKLLLSPTAKTPVGWAQVRVLVTQPDGTPIPQTLARVVPAAGGPALGFGQTDARGEALVALPGLQYFTAGATEAEVFALATEAKLELIFPPAGVSPVDWTVLAAATVASPDHVDPHPLHLRPGKLYSRVFPFTP